MELNLDWQAETSELWPHVRYELRPLRLWAYQELLAFWEQQGTAPGPAALSGQATLELVGLARRIFPEHVRGLRGLTLRREGGTEAATPEALCEEAALLPLAAEILGRLVTLSQVGDEEEKK